MNIIPDKLLAAVPPDMESVIHTAAATMPWFNIITAASEKEISEQIDTHDFFLVIADASLSDPHIPSLAAMLNRHKKIKNTPLLVISRTDDTGNKSCRTLPGNGFIPELISDQNDLFIDFIAAPFQPKFLQAKMRFFYEFFKQKSTLNQSLEELDKAYKKMIEQHDTTISRQILEKKSSVAVSMAINQIQPPMRSLWAGISRLQNDKALTGKSRAALSAIKNSSQQIDHLTKKLSILPKTTESRPAATHPGTAAECRILYVENSNEDFGLFNHLIKDSFPCRLIQAASITESMAMIADTRFDAIFASGRLPDGSGVQLVTQLKPIQPDIPVILTLNRADAQTGPEAVSKGAYHYLIKEDLSGEILASAIFNAVEKSDIIRDTEAAREKIILISQKDALTKLFNRRQFEIEIQKETAKANRYNGSLTLLMVQFNTLTDIAKTHGHALVNHILTTSAALMQSMIRESDIIGRWGQDQFGIILPHTDRNGGSILAHRIIKKIQSHTFDMEDIDSPPILVGKAQWDVKSDLNYESLIKTALENLTDDHAPI